MLSNAELQKQNSQLNTTDRFGRSIQPPATTPAATTPPPAANGRADINAQFKAVTGRDITDWEWNWANSASVTKTYGPPTQSLLAYQAPRIKGVADQIYANAQAAGVNISAGDAMQMANKYLPSNGSTGDQEIGNAVQLGVTELGRKLNEQTNADTQKKIDEIKNPVVSDQNRGDAARLVKDTLGRDATPDEADYYARHLAAGDHPYDIAQYLKQTPEFQQAQAKIQQDQYKTESQAASDQLNQNLATQQQEAFKRAMPNIIASYMKAGRLSSSGLDNAVAQAQGDLERQRQAFIGNIDYQNAVQGAGYKREDFLNNNAQAFQNYMRQSEPSYQNQVAAGQAQHFVNYQQPYNALSRQYQLQDAGTQRQYALQDYGMQRNDYFSGLNQQYSQQKKLLPYQLLGSVLGGATQFGLSKFK